MSPLAQVELHAGFGRADPGLVEHGRRRVEAEDRPAGRPGDRDGDPPVADRQLDQRAVGGAGQPDVEGDVGGHVRGPGLVPGRERLVPAH